MAGKVDGEGLHRLLSTLRPWVFAASRADVLATVF
jgi:hypothetical protein